MKQSREAEIPKGGLKKTAVETTYHVNRCSKCGRLVTKLEVIAVLEGRKPLPVCPCGSNSVRPSNAKWWEYFLPRVIRLCWAVIRGQVEPGVAA